MNTYFKNIKLILRKNKYFSTLIIPDINTNTSTLHINNYKTLLKSAENLTSPIKVLLYGHKIPDSLIETVSVEGIEELIIVEDDHLLNPSSENLSQIISSIQKEYNFKSILMSSNNFGKNIIPRLGGLLNVEPLSDVSKIISNTTFQRYLYAGNAISTVENTQNLNLLSIRLTSFDKKEIKSKHVQRLHFKKYDISHVRSSKHIENITVQSDKPELGSASVVISGGRALKSADNFKLLDDLSKCFKGAAIGASRAAVDAGYCSNDMQIGQTGKTVAPELYIAIGISGAIQHIAGMKDSKYIVAINSDPEAPIFSIASYGLVGDLFKIVPELTEKLRKDKGI